MFQSWILFRTLVTCRMWITYNRAPYDNGNPIGEEIQVCLLLFQFGMMDQNELYTYLENGKDSALEMFNALKDYHHVRANSINSVGNFDNENDYSQARGNLNVVDLAESIHALDISQYIQYNIVSNPQLYHSLPGIP